MKSFGNFEFLVENGSRSEIGISGCDMITMKHTVIYPDSGPSSEVVALCLVI
jgi:hypothetical protein